MDRPIVYEYKISTMDRRALLWIEENFFEKRRTSMDKRVKLFYGKNEDFCA